MRRRSQEWWWQSWLWDRIQSPVQRCQFSGLLLAESRLLFRHQLFSFFFLNGFIFFSLSCQLSPWSKGCVSARDKGRTGTVPFWHSLELDGLSSVIQIYGAIMNPKDLTRNNIVSSCSKGLKNLYFLRFPFRFRCLGFIKLRMRNIPVLEHCCGSTLLVWNMQRHWSHRIDTGMHTIW